MLHFIYPQVKTTSKVTSQGMKYAVKGDSFFVNLKQRFSDLFKALFLCVSCTFLTHYLLCSMRFD